MAVDYTNLSIGMQIASQFISLAFTIPLSGFVLWLTGKMFKEQFSYGKSVLAALIIGVVGIVIGSPAYFSGSLWVVGSVFVVNILVGIALYLTLPKFIFKLSSWGEAVGIGAIWLVLAFVVNFMVELIVGIILGVLFVELI
jgi:FtsH-binding integral membrane protein